MNDRQRLGYTLNLGSEDKVLQLVATQIMLWHRRQDGAQENGVLDGEKYLLCATERF